MSQECRMAECGKPVKAKGLCTRHYTRWRRYGDPSVVLRGPEAPKPEMTAKVCGVCGETKPLNEFGRDKRNRDGLKGRCRPCDTGRQLAWRAANPERWREIQQRHNVRRLPERWQDRILRDYGLSVESYQRMLDAQGGVCAICKRPPSGFRRRFSIDHDHTCCTHKGSCGKCIRGLLCGSCNTAIGLLGEDPKAFEAAVSYLRAAAPVA